MGFEIDPQVLEELAPLLVAEAEPPAVGHVAGRRHDNRQLFAQALASRPAVPGIDVAPEFPHPVWFTTATLR